MLQHKEMERLHLFTAAGTNSFTARSKSTLSTLTISLYCPKCSLRTWNMHSQNNKASWRHLRKASRKSLPCMLIVERTKTITKLVFSSGGRPQLDTDNGLID